VRREERVGALCAIVNAHARYKLCGGKDIDWRWKEVFQWNVLCRGQKAVSRRGAEGAERSGEVWGVAPGTLGRRSDSPAILAGAYVQS
jgi:hypothetical protein